MGRKNSSTVFGVDALLKYRPKHAALLAGISNAWSSVEIALTDLFGYLVASRYFTKRGGWSADPMSNALWDSFQLIDQRVNLLRAAFNTRITDDGLKGQFEDLMTKVKKSAHSRNTFVHAAWAVADEYPEHIIRTKLRFEFEKDEPTNLEELWKVIRKIQRTASAVHGFYLVVQSYTNSKLPLDPPQSVATSNETVELNMPIVMPKVFDPPIFDDLPT